MSETQLNSTPIKSTATRARRGAAAVIAQYIQDLSGAGASLANAASAAPSPCAS
jgi:hypothetical protein